MTNYKDKAEKFLDEHLFTPSYADSILKFALHLDELSKDKPSESFHKVCPYGNDECPKCKSQKPECLHETHDIDGRCIHCKLQVSKSQQPTSAPAHNSKDEAEIVHRLVLKGVLSPYELYLWKKNL